MSKAITFFRNRQQKAGLTYELEIEDSKRTYRILVYARKPLDEALIASRQLVKGSPTDEVDKITQALLRAEGGVVAVTYEENRERLLVVLPAAPGGKAAFGSFGLLLPGHPSLRLESLSDKGIKFPPGSHALVPVDKEAEESLGHLKEAAGYLPPDLESLVFHAIRDPSLDFRVGRLEATTLKGTAEPGAAPTRRSGVAEPWYRSWLKRPVPVWPVAAIVLGLMLAANSILLYSVYSFLQSIQGAVEVLGSSSRPSKVSSSTQTATPGQKIFAVIEAVRGKSSNPRFAVLARGHFSKVQKEGDVATVLAQKDNGALLVRGLLKLEALRLDSSAADDLFETAENPSKVNIFYGSRNRNLDAIDRDMLAALVCVAYSDPALPPTPTTASVRFAESGQGCQSFPLERATPGLDELLKLVREAD